MKVTEEPPGQPRLVMLETIREYASGLLEASGDEAATRQAHASHYLDLVARLNIWKTLSDQVAALALLEVEQANLRGALAWLWDQGPAGAIAFCRCCGDAFAFWWARGHLQEGLAWLDRALTLTVPQEERVSVLLAASYLRVARGEVDLAVSLAREAVVRASAVGYHWIHAWGLFALGWCVETAGEMDESTGYYEEGLVIARNEAEPYPFQLGMLTHSLAFAAFRARDLDRAESFAREALAALAPVGERYGAGYVLRTLGWVLHHKGDAAGALDAWRDAFRASCEMDDPQQIADTLAAFGRAAVDAGQAELAARWLGATDPLRERAGRRRLENHDLFEQTVALARSQLDAERFDVAWRAGRALAASQAWTEIEGARLGEAAAGDQAPASLVSGLYLTRREHEILDLLVSGMTNREIAEALSASVRTVEGHVAHLLTKLGVGTRTAAATAAVAAGLVVPHASERPALPL